MEDTQDIEDILRKEVIDLMKAGESDEFIKFYYNKRRKELSAPGEFLPNLKEGFKEGISNTGRVMKLAGGSGPLQMQAAIEMATGTGTYRSDMPAEGFAGKAGRMLGTMIGEAPINVPLSMGLGSVAKAPILEALGPATTKAGAFIKGAIAGTPGNVLASAVSERLARPETTKTKEDFIRIGAWSLVGSVMDGAFNVRNTGRSLAQAVIESPNPAEAAKQASVELDIRAKDNPGLSVKQLDLFGEQPVVDTKQIDIFNQAQPEPTAPSQPPLVELQRLTKRHAKVVERMGSIMDNIRRGSVRDADLNLLNTYIREEADLLDKIDMHRIPPEQMNQMVSRHDLVIKRINDIADNIQKGSVKASEVNLLNKYVKEEGELIDKIRFMGRLSKGEELPLDKIVAKHSKIIEKIGNVTENMRKKYIRSADVNLLAKYAKEEDNLIEQITNLNNVIKQSAEYQIELPLQGVSKQLEIPFESPWRPGSGKQSPYPYVPPEVSGDPTTPILKPKVQGTVDPPPNLSEAEKPFFEKIDFGNKNAQEARFKEAMLLETPLERADFATTDFLLPIRKVSQKAGELSQNFLRWTLKARHSILNDLTAPDLDGNARVVGPGLGKVIQAVGGNADDMNRFAMFVHAKQTLGQVQREAGLEYIKTPWTVEEATKLVNQYAQDYPKFVQAYDEVYIPFVKGLKQALYDYGLISKDVFDSLDNPAYAPLFRSVYSNTSGFLKTRTNPESQKLVADLWASLYDMQRAIIFNGERNRILAELAKARIRNPDLAGIVDVKEWQFTPQIKEALELVKQQNPDVPEVLQKAMAEAMSIDQGLSGKYNFKLNGINYSLQVNNELAESLGLMQWKGTKQGFVPENAPKLEKFFYKNLPANAAASTEKAATGIFSVYRDLVRAGVLQDAVDLSIYAKNKGWKFNILTDPVAGIFELYKDNSQIVNDLIYNGGGNSFRYADPNVEEIARNVEELSTVLQRYGKNWRLHPSNWGKVAKEFAGNLSNAGRMGLVVRNYKDVPMSELVQAFNASLGDPALSGARLAAASRFIGFMNYPIQAAKAQYKLVFGKSTRENPQLLAKTLIHATKLLVPATVINWYLNKDDEKIRALRNDRKGAGYFYIGNPLDPNSYFAVPKPQGPVSLGLVNAVETLLDELQDSNDTDALSRIWETTQRSTIPNFVPLMVQGGITLVTGQEYNLDGFGFKNYSVIPQGRKNLLPEDARSGQTSNLAQFLAQKTGKDAGVLDRIVKTMLVGNLYNDFLRADQAIAGSSNKNPSPSNKSVYIPFLGLSTGSKDEGGRRYMEKFYNDVDKYTPVINSLNRAMLDGAPERVDAIYNAHKDKIEQALKVAMYKELIDRFNEQINFTRFNEAMTPDEKRDEILILQRERTKLAKQYLGIEDRD
jgi:hypothetical protein